MMQESSFDLRQFLAGSLASAIVIGAFAVWADLDPVSLQDWAREDGPLESCSALFFGIAGIGFLITLKRRSFLDRQRPWSGVMTLGWALLMFLFMAEEISWGQRLFAIPTPTSLEAANTQGELNLHNLEVVDEKFGGTYRLLTIFTLLTGGVLPLAALTRVGRQLFRRFYFPVVPAAYMVLFVGAYFFGRAHAAFSVEYAGEVREFFIALGMLCFAFHGALRPDELFRVVPVRALEEEAA
jgi:hypothetical protein